jgi:hypothetical protein
MRPVIEWEWGAAEPQTVWLESDALGADIAVDQSHFTRIMFVTNNRG